MTDSAVVPDLSGHFGRYGGRFVPEALVAAIDDLTAAFHETQADPAFRAELQALQAATFTETQRLSAREATVFVLSGKPTEGAQSPRRDC